MSEKLPREAEAALPKHEVAPAVEDDSDPDIDELDGMGSRAVHGNSIDTVQMSSTNFRPTQVQRRDNHNPHQMSPHDQLQDPADPPSPKCPKGNFLLNRKMNSWPD